VRDVLSFSRSRLLMVSTLFAADASPSLHCLSRRFRTNAEIRVIEIDPHGPAVRVLTDAGDLKVFAELLGKDRVKIECRGGVLQG